MFFGVDISLGTFSGMQICFSEFLLVEVFSPGFFSRTCFSKIRLVDVFLFIFLGRCFQSSFGRNCFSQFFGGDVFWCFGIFSGYFMDVFLLKSLVCVFFLNCLMGMFSWEPLEKRALHVLLKDWRKGQTKQQKWCRKWWVKQAGVVKVVLGIIWFDWVLKLICKLVFDGTNCYLSVCILVAKKGFILFGFQNTSTS